ncbi:MAG: NAD(P)H-binding protein, partial [Thermoanaerobaculia bacterium]
MRILVTGATGYVGGRLIPRLLAAGHEVRVLVRDASRVAGRPWLPRVEVAVGDLLDRDSLARALEGMDQAYYLVHSMLEAGFEEMDRRAAATFVDAAPATLRKVIYLGGLLPRGEQRSMHLRSRAEVGAILARSLPVLELRAGPIIGSGSASFEMVRYLTERLPAMVAPRWIDNEV